MRWCSPCVGAVSSIVPRTILLRRRHRSISQRSATAEQVNGSLLVMALLVALIGFSARPGGRLRGHPDRESLSACRARALVPQPALVVGDVVGAFVAVGLPQPKAKGKKTNLRRTPGATAGLAATTWPAAPACPQARTPVSADCAPWRAARSFRRRAGGVDCERWTQKRRRWLGRRLERSTSACLPARAAREVGRRIGVAAKPSARSELVSGFLATTAGAGVDRRDGGRRASATPRRRTPYPLDAPKPVWARAMA
jgi:hypothetical protein